MRIVLVSNVQNGIGLQKDCELLSAFLASLGHEVALQQFDGQPLQDHFDYGLFLETIVDSMVPLADRWDYFANPEWLSPDKARLVKKHCGIVFAKTREAESVLRKTFPNVEYVGFLTEDKGDPSIWRQKRFLHIGGNGGHRNTNAVISAWREYRYWTSDYPLPELTVVSNSKTVEPIRDVQGVTFIRRATDEQIKELQNSHLFHLFPSGYEGFGHALHESQSCSAILLTTDAAPMNEVDAPFKVPSAGTKVVNMGTVHEVSGKDIREAATKMAALTNRKIAHLQKEARQRFERGNQEFRELFPPHLEGNWKSSGIDIVYPAKLHTPKLRSLRIAFLGNFVPPHSTENDLKWTLEDMGHKVTAIQENELDASQIVHYASAADLFLWVHTHGWDRTDYTDMLRRFELGGKKTASFHLDRFWGLNQLDGREDKIGKHPFWKTDHVFSADGGNQARFAERGVAHHWLPPGVVRRDCYRGSRRDDLVCDVGFVGAEGYHPEYPFRKQLIDFLRETYGERFRIFQGYRGEDLNDLYQSIRVVVGDSCFAGSDYYWSDRIPETLGRGGFLIHPACRGLTIPGLVTFEAGNLKQLKERIDYYLEHESEREHLRCAAHDWVKRMETYHNRMETLLEVCGL